MYILLHLYHPLTTYSLNYILSHKGTIRSGIYHFQYPVCPSRPPFMKRSEVFTLELLQRPHLRYDQAAVAAMHCDEADALDSAFRYSDNALQPC